jgi:hypothetical protein
MRVDLARIFPQLESAPYEVTSPEDLKYNCVAWAAGELEVRRKWWPAPSPFYYWPVEPREESVRGFIRAFAQLGYAVCDTDDLEPGVEKLAIYADGTGTPTHMARQLTSGYWTSKLGELEDIEHSTLDQLGGSDYGRAVQFLKRKRTTS